MQRRARGSRSGVGGYRKGGKRKEQWGIKSAVASRENEPRWVLAIDLQRRKMNR